MPALIPIIYSPPIPLVTSFRCPLCISMFRKLLPASAAAFTPRSASIVVVDPTEELSWLTIKLVSIGILESWSDCSRQNEVLTNVLSSTYAIWLLCSLMLQRAPLSETISDYQLIHIEAYVVHVDLVHTNKVVFKLVPESIAELTEYHKDIYLLNTAAACNDWSEERAKELQDKFVDSVNRFV